MKRKIYVRLADNTTVAEPFTYVEGFHFDKMFSENPPENMVAIETDLPYTVETQCRYLPVSAELVDNVWTATYETIQFTVEEYQPHLAKVRTAQLSKRLFLLKDSDWTQMPDSPLGEEDKAVWKVYRQALRDVPAQRGFPFDIDWPIHPKGLVI
jgi:hypothetical protein